MNTTTTIKISSVERATNLVSERKTRLEQDKVEQARRVEKAHAKLARKVARSVQAKAEEVEAADAVRESEEYAAELLRIEADELAIAQARLALMVKREAYLAKHPKKVVENAIMEVVPLNPYWPLGMLQTEDNIPYVLSDRSTAMVEDFIKDVLNGRLDAEGQGKQLVEAIDADVIGDLGDTFVVTLRDRVVLFTQETNGGLAFEVNLM